MTTPQTSARAARRRRHGDGWRGTAPRRLGLVALLLPLLLAFHDGRRFPPMSNDFAWSGIVEGMYGPVYSFEARRDLFEFVARAGMNTWLYAPKNDPLHRDRWREPYPPEYLAHFGELATRGAEIGVRFVFAIAPGLTFDPGSDDQERLEAKLDSLFDVGVRDFCILFDDVIGADFATDPDVQVDMVLGVRAHLRARAPAASLCFISHFYEGRAEELAADATFSHSLYPGGSSSAAYAAYRRIPVDVPILWTGPRVFSDRLTVADAQHLVAFAGRPVIVWDNYPVNDGLLTTDLFLGPYRGREPGLDAVLTGILVNPMQEPAASKIPLFTVGRALALGTAYDPEEAWHEALAVVGGSRRGGSLGVLADHFRSHPLIGDDPESPTLHAAVLDFFAADTGRTRRRLRNLFRRYARNDRKLARVLDERGRGGHPDPALLAELREPSRKLALLGKAGLLALRALARQRRGKPIEPDALEATLADAAAIPWLVGANDVSPALAAFLSEKETPNLRDAFGDFFADVWARLAAA